MFVSAVIVYDYVKFLMGVFSVEMFQEAKELRMCVGIDTSSLYEPLVDEQGSQQAGCTMPGVSMGLPPCSIWSHGQHGLGPVKRLDL